MDQRAAEIGCDLHTASSFGPVESEWGDLTTSYTSVERTPQGAKANLPLRLHQAVSKLIDRENACCPFLTFELQHADHHLTLTVTSQNPDAIPIIESLVGLDIDTP